jgi:AhpD family alkylhydroperoxidase
MAPGQMLAVNSANECPYCTGLHVELGRMAGLGDAAEINTITKSADEIERDAEEEAFVRFGRLFGQNDGRGPCVEKSYKDIAEKFGGASARAARGLGFFLYWGSMSGNTLNAFYFGTLCCKRKKGTNPLFEILFALWYCLLFVIIQVVSKILSCFPVVPKCISMMLGVVLALVASIWILPFGILGLLTGLLGLRCCKVWPTIPAPSAPSRLAVQPAAVAPEP